MHQGVDKAYGELISKILTEGRSRPNRTGVEALSIFGPQLRVNLRAGFPLVTLKRTHFKSILHEFIWMVCRGETNIRYLQDNGVTIWNEWADANGNLGPVYGHQFRAWELPHITCSTCGGDGVMDGYDANGSPLGEVCVVCRGTSHRIIDQVQELIDGIKTDPYSRRHIISLWNVADLSKMALPPCHAFSQFYVSDQGLSCHMYQRSADVALGVPFNIAFYALFTHLIAQHTGLQVNELIISFGDAHIYQNHIEGMKEMLKRWSLGTSRLVIQNQHERIDDYQASDFKLLDYRYHPAIKLPIAV